MNLAWKLVIYTLMINIASGITINALEMDYVGQQISFDEEQFAKMDIYDSQNTNTTVFDQVPVQTETNWADNLLGLLGLGFIVDAMDFMTDYLYAAPKIILGILPSEAQAFEMYLNGLISIMYSLSLFALFTGKELNKEG